MVNYMMGRYGYGLGYPKGWGIGFGFVGLLMQVIIWVAIIYGIIWFIKSMKNGKMGGADTALEILKQRYAKGEITKKEFEEMKKDIS
jgi:putative membrane protein